MEQEKEQAPGLGRPVHLDGERELEIDQERAIIDLRQAIHDREQAQADLAEVERELEREDDSAVSGIGSDRQLEIIRRRAVQSRAQEQGEAVQRYLDEDQQRIDASRRELDARRHGVDARREVPDAEST